MTQVLRQAVSFDRQPLKSDLLDAAIRCDTPRLLYSSRRISENCRRFVDISTAIFSDLASYYFSLKTAHFLPLLNKIAGHGIGAEVICAKELSSAVKTGFESIILDGPVKSDGLLDEAMKHGCRLICIDGLAQINAIERIAAERGQIQDISVRLKVEPGRRLGIGLDDLARLQHSLKQSCYVRFRGFHIHPGSNLDDEPCIAAYRRLLTAERRSRALGITPELRNIGSGFPTFSDDPDAVERRLGRIAEMSRDSLPVVIEPGRPLVGDAAVLSAMVTQVRQYERLCLVDTAVTIINGPCAATPQLFHWSSKDGSLTPVHLRQSGEGWRLGGIWPAEADMIRVDFTLPPAPGDRMIWGQAGAYSLGFQYEFSLNDFAPELI